MPNIWFLLPSPDSPTGGVNNCYRLCLLAEELGIRAGVISQSPYPFCDPEDNRRFWRPTANAAGFSAQFDIPEIEEGDLVIQAELYRTRFDFSKKVRRIVFVQNWAITHPWSGWQEQIWTYNNWVHLTYCIESFKYTDYIPRLQIPQTRPADWEDTAPMFKKKKVKWSCVNPYFDFDKYRPGDNDPNRVLFLPRRMGAHAGHFRDTFGDKLVMVDGVPPDQLRQMYRQVGILLSPSPSEGLAFPIIEALSSGCCVVAWECGGPEEYLIHGETAMLSEFGDFDALVRNVNYLIENPSEQRRMSRNGRELVKGLYNRERAKLELYLAYHSSLRTDPQ